MKNVKLYKVITSIIIVLVLSFSILYLSVVQKVRIPFVSNAVHSTVSFLGKGLSGPIGFISEKKDAIQDLMSAYDENKQLKESVASLKEYASENATLREENESLKNALELKQSVKASKKLSAGVIDRNSASWSDSLTIDLGSKDGISEGMLVIGNHGLLGYVSSVYARTSKVMLLTNTKGMPRIHVRLSAEKDIYGVLSGYDVDSGTFVIDQLTGTDLKVGEMVVTSELSQATPEGIQVGTIDKIQVNANNLSSTVYVKPTANFDNIYSVVVVGK